MFVRSFVRSLPCGSHLFLRRFQSAFFPSLAIGPMAVILVGIAALRRASDSSKGKIISLLG